MARGRTKGGGAEGAGQATREQLLDATSDLMIEGGSIHISLSEIAARSGLNAALVKYHFGNKAGLLVALLRRALGPAMEQVGALAAMHGSPTDKLRIHISGMVNSYFRYPYVNRLMHQMLAEDSATFGPLIAEEFTRPVAEAHRRILADGVAQGLFRNVDPALFYFVVVGACDQLFYGRYHLKHIFGVDEIDEPLKRRYADHLYGLVTRGLLVDVAIAPDPPHRSH